MSRGADQAMEEFVSRYAIWTDPLLRVGDLALVDRAQFIFCAVQGELIALLRRFLNGDTLTSPSKVLHPVSNRHEGPVVQRLHQLLRFAEDAIYPFEAALSALDESPIAGTRSSEALARIISATYRELYDAMESFDIGANAIGVNISTDFEAWRSKAGDADELRPVIQLLEDAVELRQSMKGFFLHGSVATLDYIPGWSDLDDLIVVSSETVVNPRYLLEFQRRIFQTKRHLYRFDPLQHHGHAFIAEQDLMFFPEAVFPLTLFDNAVCLIGEDVLSIGLRPDHFERRESLLRLIAGLERMKHGSLHRAYVLKAYMSALMLLPSLYLQVQGTDCYKKDSFALARPDFGDDWRAVELSTKLREEWSIPFRRWLIESLGVLPNPNAVSLYHYVMMRSPVLARRQIGELVASVGKFTARILANLEEAGFLVPSGSASPSEIVT
jgi:hypothetical protein